jgi:hypothetical protein
MKDVGLCNSAGYDIHVLREKVDREHDLLNTRTNIFLLWQSILMAGFAAGSSTPSVLTLVSILGLLSSVVWIYIGIASRQMTEWYWTQIRSCESALPKQERLYSDSRDYRKKAQGRLAGLSVSKCLVYIFPTMWAATWIAACIIENYEV